MKEWSEGYSGEIHSSQELVRKRQVWTEPRKIWSLVPASQVSSSRIFDSGSQSQHLQKKPLCTFGDSEAFFAFYIVQIAVICQSLFSGTVSVCFRYYITEVSESPSL